jgi:hypothetical protein
MLRQLLSIVAVLLVSLTIQAESPAPFGCEVIRPVAEADMLRSTMAALSHGAKRRSVGVGVTPIEIDVLEVYGPELLRGAGNAEAARTLLQFQVDTTNRALSDSGLGNIRLRLRHVRFSQDYDRFPGNNAGPEIEQDRQYYGADLLGFAVGETPSGIIGAACRPPAYGPGCGVHWLHQANFAQFPFAFVHEIGHNLGADHDAPNAMPRDVDPHPFARAHCVPGQWRTVMSYGSPCNVNPVLLFSNPNRMFRGLSTGVRDEADNARAIALSAPFVRDYYPATQNTGPRCEFRITFDDSEVPIAGETRTLVAERTRGDCEPAITSLDEWVHVEVAPSSTAERTEAVVTYLPNGQPQSRRGHFVVGEQPLSIEQSGTAECLLPNGSFDHDVSGWTVRPFAVNQGTISWSPLDAGGKADSGSAMLTLNGSQFGVDRCVAVEPLSQYVMRSSVFMPPGQQADIFDFPAFQSISLFDTPDCSGSDSGFGDSITNIAGSWLRIESSFHTYTNTHSAKISLNVNVAAGSFTTYYDDIEFCRIGDALP